MKRFDYSFLENSIPNEIVNKLIKIYELKGMIYRYVYKNTDEDDKLIKKNIYSMALFNNDINGIDCTINEVIELENKKRVDSEIENSTIGYMNAIKFVFDNFDNLKIDKKTLYKIYDLIKNDGLKHEFKTEDNVLMKIKNGKEEIILNPTKAEKVNEEIELIISKYEKMKAKNVNDLLLSINFITDLYTIEPFDDHNDEIIRIILLLELLKNEFNLFKVTSLESVIHENTKKYNEVFNSSVDSDLSNVDYYQVINYFLDIIIDCNSSFGETIDLLNEKKEKKSDRISELLLNSKTALSKSDIKKQIDDASLNMIELVLSNLLKENKIKKIGSFKDAKYIKC